MGRPGAQRRRPSPWGVEQSKGTRMKRIGWDRCPDPRQTLGGANLDVSPMTPRRARFLLYIRSAASGAPVRYLRSVVSHARRSWARAR